MVLIALSRTTVLLILAAIGLLCTHLDIIDKERSKGLSDIIMYVLTPALFINSLQIDYDPNHLKGFIIVFVSILIGYLVNFFVAKAILKTKDEDTSVVLDFAAVFPNAAFMGIPLVQALLGDDGVFYLAAAVAAVNLCVFTINVYYLQRDRSGISLRSFILSPVIISILTGILLFALHIRLPEIIMTPVSMLGGAVTPMAMLVAGYSIANTDFREKAYTGKICIAMLWKLLIMPILFGLCMSLVPGFNIPILAGVICFACPSGAFAVFLAVKYERNDSIGSQMFTYTTVLSILSIPAVMWVMQLLGYHL